jgi:hypothetical protein
MCEEIHIVFYDILVISNTHEEHAEHLYIVLYLLKEHKLFASFSKCVFAVPQIDYIGHIISAEGLLLTPQRLLLQLAGLHQPLPLG